MLATVEDGLIFFAWIEVGKRRWHTCNGLAECLSRVIRLEKITILARNLLCNGLVMGVAGRVCSGRAARGDTGVTMTQQKGESRRVSYLV